jgi:hypothetical protein
MNKSDKSILNICIAKIKRSTIKPYDFVWTKFYELNSTFYELYPNVNIDISENELIICSTIINLDNYSILTTQRIITKKNGNLNFGNLIDAEDKLYGDFKGYQENETTFGQIKLSSGEELKYFIETGNASMVMIHGVRAILKTSTMTSNQIEKVTRIWNKQCDR